MTPTASQYLDLGAARAAWVSEARALSDAGLVAGIYRQPDGRQHAVVWRFPDRGSRQIRSILRRFRHAWCYEQRLTRGWPSSQPEDAGLAVRLARGTVDADTGDANAISIAGFVLVMVGRDYERGLAALRDAVRLNPFDVFVLMNGGWGEVWAGSLDDAALLFQRARALSPRDPAAYFVVNP